MSFIEPGQPTFLMPVQPTSIAIRQWCPTPDGAGPATQVHVIFEVDKGAPIPPMAIRFKSRQGLEAFVADLVANADEVWPKGKT